MMQSVWTKRVMWWRRMLVALFLVNMLLFGVTALRDSRSLLIDLYANWITGHYLRQGMEPYSAWYAGQGLSLPAAHLFGPPLTAADVGRLDGLWWFPSNAAPVLLVMGGLSFLPWGAAAVLWTGVNTGLLLVIPMVLVRVLRGMGLAGVDRWPGVVLASFVGLNAVVRGGLDNGQTVFLILLAMLLTLYFMQRDRNALAGLLLGLALSKISLALPVALFVVYCRRWRVLFAAALVQGGAFALVALIGGSGLFETVATYLTLVATHPVSNVAGLYGVHLGSYLPPLDDGLLPGLVLASLPLVAVGGWLWRRGLRAWPLPEALAALSAWSLLVVYHLGYDVLLGIVPLALLLAAGAEPVRWALSPRVQRLLLGLYGTVMGLLILPGSAYRWLFASSRADNVAVTVAVLLLYGGSLWLLARRGQIMTTDNVKNTQK